MAGMGPPPKPADQRRRRNTVPGTVYLPAEGRPGPAPEWPLPGKPVKAEVAIWEELWRKPQAVAWERFEHERTVARYSRLLVQAERRDAKPPILTEVRQLEDRLGLSPMAMLRLRWEIVADEVGEARSVGAGAGGERRLRPVDQSAAGE